MISVNPGGKAANLEKKVQTFADFYAHLWYRYTCAGRSYETPCVLVYRSVHVYTRVRVPVPDQVLIALLPVDFCRCGIVSSVEFHVYIPCSVCTDTHACPYTVYTGYVGYTAYARASIRVEV